MRISAKTEYACIAVMELGNCYGAGDPVRVRDIAERHGIPARFLVQILLQLKAAGFVASTRGASGGYRLVRSPDEITLGEVMTVVEGADDTSASSLQSSSRAAAVLRDSWQAARQAQAEVLSSITLTDLVDRAAVEAESMYYI
ncbi:MAG: Rrf2 family transcriptional regulator [Pirellulales bacterium]